MSGFSQASSPSYPAFVADTGQISTVVTSAYDEWDDVFVPSEGQAFSLILATAQCTAPTGNSRYDLAIIPQSGSGAAYLARNQQVTPSDDLQDAIILTSEPVVISYPMKLQVREKSAGSAPAGSLSLRVAAVRAY